MSSEAQADPIAVYGAVVATCSFVLVALSLVWQLRTWRREHGTWLVLDVVWRGRVAVGATDLETEAELAIRVWNRGTQPVKVTQIALDPNLVRWFDRRISWLFVRPLFDSVIERARKRRYLSLFHRGDVPAGVRYFAVPLKELAPHTIDADTRVRGVIWLSNGDIRRSRRMKAVGDASVIPADWIIPASG
jgi:hypothetical protein